MLECDDSVSALLRHCTKVTELGDVAKSGSALH